MHRRSDWLLKPFLVPRQYLLIHQAGPFALLLCFLLHHIAHWERLGAWRWSRAICCTLGCIHSCDGGGAAARLGTGACVSGALARGIGSG
jgi:hypothetical protein